MGRTWAAWIPARYLSLVWIVGLFLAVNGIARFDLTAFERGSSNLLPWRFAATLSIESTAVDPGQPVELP